MKSVQSWFPVVTAVLGLAAYSGVTGGSDQEPIGVGNTLDQEVSMLEQAWMPGAAAEEYEYYSRAGQIAESLSSGEEVAANVAATKLLKNLLSKKAELTETSEAAFEVGAADLVAMEKVARYLLSNDNIPIPQRQQKTKVLASLLGRVRQEAVPNYVPRQVVTNVAPPAGVPGMAGMDPAAIADPAARRIYEEAIRENRLNNLTNKRQSQLHDMETELARPIVEYMSRAAAVDKTASNVISQSINAALLTDKEKAEVMHAVSR